MINVVQVTTVRRVPSSPPNTPATTAPTTTPPEGPVTLPASCVTLATIVLDRVSLNLQGPAWEAGTVHLGLGLTNLRSLATTQGSAATALLRASAASALLVHSALKVLMLLSPAQLGSTVTLTSCPMWPGHARLGTSAAAVPPSPTQWMKPSETSALKVTTAQKEAAQHRPVSRAPTPGCMVTTTAAAVCHAQLVSTAPALVWLPLSVTVTKDGSVLKAWLSPSPLATSVLQATAVPRAVALRPLVPVGTTSPMWSKVRAMCS